MPAIVRRGTVPANKTVFTRRQLNMLNRALDRMNAENERARIIRTFKNSIRRENNPLPVVYYLNYANVNKLQGAINALRRSSHENNKILANALKSRLNNAHERFRTFRRNQAVRTIQQRYRNMFRMSGLPRELGDTEIRTRGGLGRVNVIRNPTARKILKKRLMKLQLLHELLNKVKRVEPVSVRVPNNTNKLLTKQQLQNILGSTPWVTYSSGTKEFTSNNGKLQYTYFPNTMKLRVSKNGKTHTYSNVRPPLRRQNQPAVALGNLLNQ